MRRVTIRRIIDGKIGRLAFLLAEHHHLRESPQPTERVERSPKGDPMKKSTKTLKLNRETLLLLEKHQLVPVEGNGTKNTLTACDGFANSGCPKRLGNSTTIRK
ncbi:MAG TPA: hypothetical protein VH988_25850, partial [Thermoanaerobaculia bacterium]|nr:hypothetical protein [Thermoanaerobaculia bacterium]